MTHLMGMGYNAVGIEHSLAAFFGSKIGARGGPHDADVFRSGNHKSLGTLLERIANRLDERLVTMPESVKIDDTALRKIKYGIGAVRGMGEELKASVGSERDDYHWLVIGNLISIIDGLLDQLNA